MGSKISRSVPAVKRIYVNSNGKQISIEFSTSCSSQDLKELLTTAAGLTKWSTISIVNPDGCLLPISSTLPANTPVTPYQLVSVNHGNEGPGNEMLNEVVSKLSTEFSKAFIDKFTKQFSGHLERISEAENLETEGLHKISSGLAPSHHTLERSTDVPQYPKYVLTEETSKYLRKPTFDIWHWEPSEMLCLLEHMYYELGLVAELKINPMTLKRWLLAVKDNYRDNPFHNFRHGFCVAQMMYGIINLCNLPETFTKLEIAVLITAAVCHDLDHPGYNNNYQINARTELAILYNDISPLENHHCAVTFQILEKPETNIFMYVRPEHYRKIRAGIIELILATDMVKHSEIMEKYKQVIAKGFDFKNEVHLQLLKMMLIKSCDVSNEVRPMEVSEPWVDCLLKEYFMQSDREKEEGLPVAPFMDREKVTKSTAQIGFIKFVLIPIFEVMKQLFPEIEEAMLQPLELSLDHYQQLQKKEDRDRNSDENRPNKEKNIATRKESDILIAVPLKRMPLSA